MIQPLYKLLLNINISVLLEIIFPNYKIWVEIVKVLSSLVNYKGEVIINLQEEDTINIYIAVMLQYLSPFTSGVCSIILFVSCFRFRIHRGLGVLFRRKNWNSGQKNY